MNKIFISLLIVSIITIAAGANTACDATATSSCITVSSNGHAGTCDGTTFVCSACASGFGLVLGGNVAGNTLVDGCKACTDTHCTACNTPSAAPTSSVGACTACAATPSQYYLDTQTSPVCCLVQNCGTCVTGGATCTTCKTGYGKVAAGTCAACSGAASTDTNCANCDGTSQAVCSACKTVSTVAYSLDNQNLCGAVANCGTHASTDVTKCASCKTGYTNTGGSTGLYTSCVQTVITPVYSVNAPQSGAFNTTPTVVFTTGDTGLNGISTSSSVYYTAGFTDATAYVWAFKYTDSTTAYTVTRRAVNATYGAAFAKLNGSDTTISTTLSPTVTDSRAAKGPGYLGIFALVQNTALYGAATATAAEITLHYAAVNGSSFTTKAITGNTATTVYFDLLSAWYDSVGIFYVVYAKNTHTVGTATVADVWAYNGVYIQGVNVGTGALVYNTTGGVQVFAITTATSTNGKMATTCTVGTDCATLPSSPVSTFLIGGNNLTNSSVASYVYKDTTPTLDVVYYGSINLLTGAGATAPTAIATETATVVATSTAAGSSLTYTPCGVLGSFATSGVFVCKSVGTQAWVATSTPPAAGTFTYVYSVLPFINGSTTASSVVNVTVQSGYQMSGIQGYGTSDGFVLIERQASTSSASPTPSPLSQYERIFTNGSASGTATSLGTYADTPQTFQDGNGSILLGYTARDTANSLTYQGLLGKTAVVQTLALSASTLTSIFAFLSLMIVAIFAF